MLTSFVMCKIWLSEDIIRHNVNFHISDHVTNDVECSEDLSISSSETDESILSLPKQIHHDTNQFAKYEMYNSASWNKVTIFPDAILTEVCFYKVLYKEYWNLSDVVGNAKCGKESTYAVDISNSSSPYLL